MKAKVRCCDCGAVTVAECRPTGPGDVVEFGEALRPWESDGSTDVRCEHDGEWEHLYDIEDW